MKAKINLKLSPAQLARIARSDDARRIATERAATVRAQAAEQNIASAMALEERREANARLRVQGAEIVENAAGEIIAAGRKDCFNLLLRDMATEAQAIAWLETVIRTAAGENGQERRPDFIRSSCEGAPGQNVTADMIEAGETLQVIAESMAPADVRMLFELLRPDEALLTRWRSVVQRCTGEINPQAQGARVRAGATSLAFVRTIIERLTRERKERKRMAA